MIPKVQHWVRTYILRCMNIFRPFVSNKATTHGDTSRCKSTLVTTHAEGTAEKLIYTRSASAEAAISCAVYTPLIKGKKRKN